MAKGKGKKSSTSGPHKKHGPKRHLFKEYKPLVKAFADAGLLDKYHNYDSWVFACTSRGKKDVSKHEFSAFRNLPFEKQKEYFNNISKK